MKVGRLLEKKYFTPIQLVSPIKKSGPSCIFLTSKSISLSKEAAPLKRCRLGATS